MLPYKITIQEIEEHLENMTPIFGIPMMKEILRININESYYKTMSKLIRQALMTFEKKNPLFMESVIAPSGSSYEFVDNFDLYLAGQLDRKYTTLIPQSVINITGSLLYQARTHVYNKPVLSFFSAPMDATVVVDYLTYRPVRLKKHPTEDEFTEDSCIYGFMMYQDYFTEQFLKELEFTVLKYIRELKAQVGYTEIPVDIFSGINDKISELDTELNEFYLSPTMYSKLWR